MIKLLLKGKKKRDRVPDYQEEEMACFLVSVAEAAVVSIAAKHVEKKENEKLIDTEVREEGRIPFSRKLRWLSNLLWGGSVLLLFEHIWHGEVVPWFPFLTAASNPKDFAEMLHEMATVGVTMALLVTLVWSVMLVVSSRMEKKHVESLKKEEGAGA